MTARTRHLMDRLDRGDFRHDPDRHNDEHDAGRYPHGVIAPLDSQHAAELDAMDARDWAEVERWQP